MENGPINWKCMSDVSSWLLGYGTTLTCQILGFKQRLGLHYNPWVTCLVMMVGQEDVSK